jgi:hypothetical protein
MLAVAITPRRGNGEDALIDANCLPVVRDFGCDGFLKRSSLNFGGTVIRSGCRRRKLREPALKGFFHELGIACCEAVLGGKRPAGPRSREIRRGDAFNLEHQPFPQCRRLISIEEARALAV